MSDNKITVELTVVEYESIVSALHSQSKFYQRCMNNPLPNSAGPGWWKWKLETAQKALETLKEASKSLT